VSFYSNKCRKESRGELNEKIRRVFKLELVDKTRWSFRSG
jgi:hypothetical protein